MDEPRWWLRPRPMRCFVKGRRGAWQQLAIRPALGRRTCSSCDAARYFQQSVAVVTRGRAAWFMAFMQPYRRTFWPTFGPRCCSGRLLCAGSHYISYWSRHLLGGHREWSNARRRMLSRSICDQGASHDQPGACSASIHGFVGPERPLYRTVFRVEARDPCWQ